LVITRHSSNVETQEGPSSLQHTEINRSSIHVWLAGLLSLFFKCQTLVFCCYRTGVIEP